MPDSTNQPRPYEDWSLDGSRRWYDAANTFGHHLMRNCYKQALNAEGSQATEAELKLIERGVDAALLHVMALLEGCMETDAGPDHKVEYALSSCVYDRSGREVERIALSPLQDLPIGYHNWKDGIFRLSKNPAEPSGAVNDLPATPTDRH